MEFYKEGDKNEYYLNHVGYKVRRHLIGAERVMKKYYLNHVGYKADEGYVSLAEAVRYYLNHVGYKARLCGVWSSFSIACII